MFNSWPICGHERIVSALQRNIRENKLSHAYLFVGPHGVGKRTLALNFIKTILCQGKIKPDGKCQACFQVERNIHPDTIIFQSSGGQIKIEKMREIQKRMSLKPLAASIKILLINEAENMTEEAANSLLKFFEEPRGRTIIILVAGDLARILPTIVSRAVVIKFFPVPKKTILEFFEKEGCLKNEEKKNLEEAVANSQGRPGSVVNVLKDKASLSERQEMTKSFVDIFFANTSIFEKFKFVSQFFKERQESLKFLENLIIFYHHLLLAKLGQEKWLDRKELFKTEVSIPLIKKNLEQIILARKMLSQNMNLKLVLENLMLNLQNE